MEPTDPKEKIEFWREHVQRVAHFEGTQSKYAELNGISASKLSYYKGMLAPKPSFAKVAFQAKTEPSAELRSEKKVIANVPDAVWLATFLKVLFR